MSFSPDGTRLITGDMDGTARLWDIRSGKPLGAEIAETLTAFCAGARLDPALGNLQAVTPEERRKLWKLLEPALNTLPDWRYVAEQALPRNPQAARVSPRMSLTIREAATSLIGTLSVYGSIREAVRMDPANPLLPFACAVVEISDDGGISSYDPFSHHRNPIRASWLIEYGMKRLPAESSAADLRLAAKLIATTLKKLPGQKQTAISLLNRARDKEPEDDASMKLRMKFSE